MSVETRFEAERLLYRGKPVLHMTKPELVEALSKLVSFYESRLLGKDAIIQLLRHRW